MKEFLKRILFVVLTSTTFVFFSEKAYWYVQGYALAELVLVYAFPVFAALWAIERFRVNRLAPLVLVSAVFAFLVEGVLTPVLYEAGLLDPVMPAYFVGWHGLFSVVFGWYLIRKWLVQEKWQRILLGATAFGLFWGTWSLTFWLPENVNDPDFLAHAADTGVPAGKWPVADFALYAFTFTVFLMLAHWLLGRGIWPREFKPSRAEIGVVFGALLLYFTVGVMWAIPLAVLKIAVLLGVVFAALRRFGQTSPHTLYQELAGQVSSTHLLVLLAMPLAATAVYGLAAALPIPETFIRGLLEGIPALQALVGGALFLWAMIATLRQPGSRLEGRARAPAPNELTS